MRTAADASLDGALARTPAWRRDCIDSRSDGGLRDMLRARLGDVDLVDALDDSADRAFGGRGRADDDVRETWVFLSEALRSFKGDTLGRAVRLGAFLSASEGEPSLFPRLVG